MLFGEHAVIYGYPCIVTAVNERILVKIQPNDSDQLLVDAPDVKVINYTNKIKDVGRNRDIPKGVRFIEAAIKQFYDSFSINQGLRIETKSTFSSKFGFGSSSAVTVAVIKAFSEIFNKKLTKKEIFDLSYKAVLDVQGTGSGFDLAASIWGGTIYFVKGGKEIKNIILEKLPLLVGYTGIKADTPSLVSKVAQLRNMHPEIVNSVFEGIGIVVEKARKYLRNLDMEKLGELMNLNQGLLESLGVNSKELSNLIFSARNSGAYGAKLSGAGGGDCMIALSAKGIRKDIEKAITDSGGNVLRVKTNAEGVRIEK